jgi:hypothetical protein
MAAYSMQKPKPPWETEMEAQILEENARQIQIQRNKDASKRKMLIALQKGNQTYASAQRQRSRNDYNKYRREHRENVEWYKNRTINKEKNYRNFYQNHLEDEKKRQKQLVRKKHQIGSYDFKNKEIHGEIDHFFNPAVYKAVHQQKRDHQREILNMSKGNTPAYVRNPITGSLP